MRNSRVIIFLLVLCVGCGGSVTSDSSLALTSTGITGSTPTANQPGGPISGRVTGFVYQNGTNVVLSRNSVRPAGFVPAIGAQVILTPGGGVNPRGIPRQRAVGTTGQGGSFSLETNEVGSQTLEVITADNQRQSVQIMILGGATVLVGNDVPVTRELALETVKSDLSQLSATEEFSTDILSILCSTHPLPEGVSYAPSFDLGATQQTLTSESWFFFVDVDPFSKYVHPVYYYLVDVETGTFDRLEANSPPSLNGYPAFRRYFEDLESQFLMVLPAIYPPRDPFNDILGNLPTLDRRLPVNAQELPSEAPRTHFLNVIGGGANDELTDVETVRNMLGQNGLPPLGEERSILVPEYTGEAAEQAIKDGLAELGALSRRQDTVLVHFAAHGTVDGGVLLEASDGPTNPPLSALLDFTTTKSCQVIIILGTCFSGENIVDRNGAIHAPRFSGLDIPGRRFIVLCAASDLREEVGQLKSGNAPTAPIDGGSRYINLLAANFLRTPDQRNVLRALESAHLSIANLYLYWEDVLSGIESAFDFSIEAGDVVYSLFNFVNPGDLELLQETVKDRLFRQLIGFVFNRNHARPVYYLDEALGENDCEEIDTVLTGNWVGTFDLGGALVGRIPEAGEVDVRCPQDTIQVDMEVTPNQSTIKFTHPGRADFIAPNVVPVPECGRITRERFGFVTLQPVQNPPPGVQLFSGTTDIINEANSPQLEFEFTGILLTFSPTSRRLLIQGNSISEGFSFTGVLEQGDPILIDAQPRLLDFIRGRDSVGPRTMGAIRVDNLLDEDVQIDLEFSDENFRTGDGLGGATRFVLGPEESFEFNVQEMGEAEPDRAGNLVIRATRLSDGRITLNNVALSVAHEGDTR